jgi:pimeloyl-ACP methyl ester carboxylesterase
VTRARDEIVRIDGLGLRVCRTGGGRPLLVLNGIGATPEMLEPFSSRLKSHEIVAVDLPGCGRSPRPGTVRTFVYLAWSEDS